MNGEATTTEFWARHLSDVVNPLIHFVPSRWLDIEALRRAGDELEFVFFHVDASDVQSDSALLDAFAEAMNFPSHFGHNWDALYDLLCDLSWIPQRRVVIIHECLSSQLTDQELRTYLEILIDAVKSWGPNENHELAAIFPLNSQERVRELLKMPS